MLYFDNHATTSVDPKVLEAMLPFFTEHFGNAESSQHPYGWKAKAAVEKAREQVAKLIGAETNEIIFTSGATESIHLAILGYLEHQGSGLHVITANAEHKATLEVCARAQALGYELTILPVDRFGRVSVEQVREALRPNTALVSLMHGNNEIGTLHPIAEIGALLREASFESGRTQPIAFHVDAAQTVGKCEIDVRAMNIDLLSISAHKFYGPKGVGALFMRRTSQPGLARVHLTPYMVGGGQERGLRGGTHNVPGIVGLGAACEISRAIFQEEKIKTVYLRDLLISEIMKACAPGTVELNGHPSERLPNNVSLTFRGIQSDQLAHQLRDIAYSSASACSSGAPSHVLQAIGQETKDPFVTTARFGLGRFTTEAEICQLIQAISAVPFAPSLEKPLPR